MSGHLHKVRHDYIRYANCWEDADILLAGLQCQPGNRILSIASAGDNSFSLLTTNPEIIVAVDVNEVQLHLVELKKAAIREFEHVVYLQFIGFEKSTERLSLFHRIADRLPPETRDYWKAHPEYFKTGWITQGKFEKYFLYFSHRILPFIHTRKRVDELFREKSADEQNAFYYKKWNNYRWRKFFKIFFSRYVMGKFGRDPAFMKEVNVPVGRFIFAQAEKHLSSLHCRQNPYLHFILKGRFDILPHYARKENYNRIRSQIDKLVTHKGLAEDAFTVHGDFDRFNLSNIFEYMDKDTFTLVARGLVQHARPGARLAYWNLMVPRALQEVTEEVRYDMDSRSWSERDHGFFYREFLVDQKN